MLFFNTKIKYVPLNLLACKSKFGLVIISDPQYIQMPSIRVCWNIKNSLNNNTQVQYHFVRFNKHMLTALNENRTHQFCKYNVKLKSFQHRYVFASCWWTLNMCSYVYRQIYTWPTYISLWYHPQGYHMYYHFSQQMFKNFVLEKWYMWHLF